MVLLKELVDNAIDAAEEAGIAPVITVTVSRAGITVEDNGPGIPADVVEAILDFSIRVSSREAYVSPTRGAQGNALKTILRGNGATTEEIDFLLEQRVELNAFASDEFVEWIEGKLQHHGIAKVVPDSDTLASAYRRMRAQALVQERINKTLAKLNGEIGSVPIPGDLIAKLQARLEADPTLRWDAVLRNITEADHKRNMP